MTSIVEHLPFDGGRLTADAVIARNAMREIEVYLPLSFVFAAPREQVDAWMTLAGLTWSGEGLVVIP